MSFNYHQHIMTSLTCKTRVANPDLLTVNRYRLSASAEYFVPNKTLYADYVAFIKELPGVEDHRWGVKQNQFKFLLREALP